MSKGTSDPSMFAKAVPDLRLVIEDLTETVNRFLPDGTLTYVNEVFCRFFGKTSEELVGSLSRW